MNPLTSELAQAHICDLRRGAGTTRRSRRSWRLGVDRQTRRERSASRANDRAFSHHFAPVGAGLFRHF
jgi:hypothetical protein